MGASKRSNYSANSRGNVGAEYARNLGVVLGLGGLSFFLGFFVLSRMVPDKHDASGLTPASAATTHDAPVKPRQTPESAPSPVRRETAAPTPDLTNKGPILEPSTEPATQPSGSLDRPAKPATPDTSSSTDSTDTTNAAGANSTTGANAAAGTNTAAGTDPETGSALPTTPRTRRHTRSTTPDMAAPSDDKTDTGSISQEDQKPSHIDRDDSGDTSARPERHVSTGSPAARSERADNTNDDSSSRSAKTVKRIRYIVHGEAYARKESAEREARRIKDLGLEAKVDSITMEDGTTVYRVQQGVYRNRSNAEKAKTQLSEAGVEAKIVRKAVGNGE